MIKIRSHLFLLLASFQLLVSTAQETTFSFESKKAYYSAEFDAPPMYFKIGGHTGLRSFRVVSRVGGVGFEEIAVPGYTVRGKSVSIFYNKRNYDGRRLGIVVNQDTIYARLPDWQLIPIAKYADSQFTSAVSLFGDQGTEDNFGVIYHPALKNTLLGVRLWHADILLQDPGEFWKLPKVSGSTILGRGETNITSKPYSSISSIGRIMSTYNDFQSWVLTDIGQRVTFNISGKIIYFTGTPYYSFWTYEKGYIDLMNQYYSYQELYYYAGSETQRSQYSKQLLNIESRLESWGEPEIEISNFTGYLKSKPDMVKDLNPNVYKSALNTMHYSAFFRYIRQNNKYTWNRFISSVRYVSPEPRVVTPNKYPR